MSPDGRSSSPRRFRRYGRLTGVVLPLAVAAAAVSAPVLATTPGTVATAAGTRTAVNDPRPPVTRSVAADDDEEEAAEGEEGGREQEARDEDGGDGGERTDQRGERDTDRGDDGRDEGENERGDEGDQGRDDRGDQGGNQGGDQRPQQQHRDDQGGNQGRNDRGDQGGDQRPQQQHRDDQGGNRDDGRRDEQGDARGGREGDCVSIDSTLRKNDQEISVAVFDGRIFIGGRTLPRGRFVWHSLSGNRGYPRGVCGATVTSVGSGVWVKAITRDGRVVETHCTIQETRGKQSSCGEWKTLESRSFRSAR